jgi:hypothetical protein
VITRRELLAAAAATGATGVATSRSAAAQAQAGVTVRGATGTLLDGSLRVNVRTSGPAEVRVRAWPVANPAAVVASRWRATNGADAAEVAMANAVTTSGAWSYRARCRPVGGGGVMSEAVRRIPARPAAGGRGGIP